MVSMLQSYVNNHKNISKPTADSNVTVTRPVVSQDSIRTHVKAYEPKGELIESNIFNLKQGIQSDINSLKSFFNAINGKGTDYSVGKINDVAVKLGSLGIASVIAAGKGSPIQKGMEFVGLGCWFGAMSLWPKLAINLPIKLFKGVDVGAQYKTSTGDIKNFYQDAQFLCWDMVSDEKIDKMGDKLGVPRDIQNRRQAVEQKAKQVATQAQTLSLLTAGFATPLVASLAADKLSKHVIKPAGYALNNSLLEATRSQINETNKITAKPNIEQFINNTVKADLDVKQKKQIVDFFVNNTQDVTLKPHIEQTVTDLFDYATKGAGDVLLDDNLEKQIIKTVQDMKMPNTDRKVVFVTEIVKSLKEKYNGNLSGSNNIGGYMTNFDREFIKKYHTFSNYKDMLANIRAVLEQNQKPASVNETKLKEELMKLSKLIGTYTSNVFDGYDRKYYTKVWNGELSNNAQVWEQMSKSLLETTKVDNKLLQKLCEASSDKTTAAAVDNIIEAIVSDTNQGRFSSAIKKLAETADSISAVQRQNFDFSMNYLDKSLKNIQDITTDVELSSLTSKMKTIIANRRQNVIADFMSATTTAYNPIRTLSILRDLKSSGCDAADYEVIKKLLTQNQTVDSFINNFAHMRDKIPNKEQYTKYMDIIFGKLSDNTRQMIGNNALADKIDNSTSLLKMLLTSLSDGTTQTFRMATPAELVKAHDSKSQILLWNRDEILRVFKANNMEKYIDEFLDIGMNNELADVVVQKVKDTPAKIDDLRRFLTSLSDSDITNIRNGNFDSIYSHLKNDRIVGPGFLATGKLKVRSLMEFLDFTDVEQLGNFDLRKSYTILTSKCTPLTMNKAFKNAAKETFVYNTWFKRVGISFLALCGVTALGLACIGRKNEFNQDKYVERKSA